MTRIAEFQLNRSILTDIRENKERYTQLSNEASSGLKVSNPGDSKFSSSIAAYRDALARIEGHKSRIANIEGILSFQDNGISQAGDLLVSAKELATQGANETLGAAQRADLAKQVFALRDHMVDLANSQYQGKFIYNGANNTTAPYTKDTYAAPASGSESIRYVFSAAAGSTQANSVTIADNVSVQTNTPGSTVFNRAIGALEELGRALSGYGTGVNGATGLPDGTGAAYTLPAQATQQTKDIQAAMDAVETARQNDILPERVSLGARLARLDSARAVMELTKTDAETALADMQNVDMAETATNLSQAQTALEASYTVSARVLKMSILDYI